MNINFSEIVNEIDIFCADLVIQPIIYRCHKFKNFYFTFSVCLFCVDLFIHMYSSIVIQEIVVDRLEYVGILGFIH